MGSDSKKDLISISKLGAVVSFVMVFTAAVGFAENAPKTGKKPKAATLTDAKAAASEVYKIDPKESTVTWVGSKKTGKSHTGHVPLSEGQVEVKNGQVVGGVFTADMTRLTDKDLESSPKDQAKLEGHLKSADFFNVEQHKEAVFKMKKAEKKSGNEYTVTGDLTMLGKTKEVTFPATIVMDKESAKGEAKVSIKRTDWGLVYGSGTWYKELTVDKVIKDEIELDLKLVAKKTI